MVGGRLGVLGKKKKRWIPSVAQYVFNHLFFFWGGGGGGGGGYSISMLILVMIIWMLFSLGQTWSKYKFREKSLINEGAGELIF